MSTRMVKDAMSRGVVTVSDDVPLAEAAKLLDAYHISGLPVVDRDGELVGVLSQTDLLRARVIEHMWTVLPGLAVRHIMSAPAITVLASATTDEAANLMEEKRINRVVVVAPDGRTPIGVLSVSDLIREMAATS